MSVLETELVKQAPEQLSDGEELTKEPALLLKYSVHKHLAEIAEVEDKTEKILDHLLEAALIDESDVCLWWRIGRFAMKTLNLKLARYSFEKGLIYCPTHWPCLDNLVDVLYIIGDYAACLHLIARAFERDESYVKGFAFRDQIFKEERHFKKDMISLKQLFVEDPDKDETEYQHFIEEALVIRGKRSLLAKREELPKAKFTKPLLFYSWNNLGECLLQMYNELTDPSLNQSLAWSVDLSKYLQTKEQQGMLAIPSPDVLAKKHFKSTTKVCLYVEFHDKFFHSQQGVTAICNLNNEHKSLSRKRLLVSGSQESEAPPKRRSTRVKLSKTKESDVNWLELVYSFFSQKLRSPVVAMETEDSQETISEECTPTSSISSTPPIRSTQELKEEAVCVSDFLNTNQENAGCIDIISNFLLAVAEFDQRYWCYGLPSIYTSLYERNRKHVQFPNPFDSDNDLTYMEKLAKMILLALEFQLDGISMKNKMLSPSTSPFKGNVMSKATDDALKKFLKDLHYLSMIGFTEQNPRDSQFIIRFYWVKARYCMMKNEVKPATIALENCLYTLKKYSESQISLSNCNIDNVISEETIKKKIESLQQSQSFDEIQALFDEGKHSVVISSLEAIIKPENFKSINLNAPERPSQIVTLLKSYYRTKKYNECIKCLKVALREGLTYVDIWKCCFNDLLCIIDSLFLAEGIIPYITDEIIGFLNEKFARFIEISMDNEPGETECMTTLPWIVTYRLICIEQNNNEMEIDNSLSSHSLELHPGTDFLRTAHDYLGRRHWCCHDNGKILQLFIKQIKIELTKKHRASVREMLLQDFEQCLFCLYGNPSKKSKSKMFQEHNDQPITLTWENAKVLYEFYRPGGLPMFDLRTHTISLEVQNVLRKISCVAPLKKIELISSERLQQYIDGGEELPAESKPKDCNGMEDIFYYLGDFYFKNKEFNKALKFYMHDVCIQPARFQSWAAMALTRGSKLEEKLNQCELRSDTPIKKHITSTLRCFEKAVKLNDKKCVMFEEYGQTTYMLNSYAARKLQQDKQEEKTLHVSHHESCLKMQQDMLKQSKSCFTNALKVATNREGEKWMHYYMLGKTSEKLNENPTVCLDFYQHALEELNRCGGELLKKIPYHGPPSYSIEAVELFYRIHASILKILKYSPVIDYDLLEKQLIRLKQQQLYQEIKDVDLVMLKEAENAIMSPNASAQPSIIDTQSRSCDTKLDSPAKDFEPSSNNCTAFAIDQRSNAVTNFAEKLSSVEMFSSHISSNDVMSASCNTSVSSSSCQQQALHTNTKVDSNLSGSLDNIRMNKNATVAITGLMTVQQTNSLKNEKALRIRQGVIGNSFDGNFSAIELNRQISDIIVSKIDNSNLSQNSSVSIPVNKPEAEPSSFFTLPSIIHRLRNYGDACKSCTFEKLNRNFHNATNSISKNKALTASEQPVQLVHSLPSSVRTSSSCVSGKLHKYDDELQSSSFRNLDTEKLSENELNSALCSDISPNPNIQTNALIGSIQEIRPDTNISFSLKTTHDNAALHDNVQKTDKKSDINASIDVDIKFSNDHAEAASEKYLTQNRLQSVTEVVYKKDRVSPSSNQADSEVLTSSSDKVMKEDDLNVGKDVQLTFQGNNVNKNLTQNRFAHLYNLHIDPFIPKKSVITAVDRLMELNDKNENEIRKSMETCAKKTSDMTTFGLSKLSTTSAISSDSIHEIAVDKKVDTGKCKSVKLQVSANKSDTKEETIETRSNVCKTSQLNIQSASSYYDDIKNLLDELISTVSISPKETLQINVASVQNQKVASTPHSDRKLTLATEIPSKCNPQEAQVTQSNNVSELLDEIILKVDRDVELCNILKESKAKFKINNVKRQFLRRSLSSNEEARYKSVAKSCLDGLAFCLRRFPEHYKSQYLMAQFVAHSNVMKDLEWSRDLLTENYRSRGYSPPLPTHGLFSLKKKTNMFQYLWRIPVNEVDRPGSFCTHIYRAVYLLLDVLLETKDNPLLLHVSAFLYKTPDKDRKYLRDDHRAFLAIKAFEYVIAVLKIKILEATDANDELFLEIYDAYKHSQKMQVSVETLENMLLQVHGKKHHQSAKSEESERQQIIDAAVKYCQQVKPVS